MEDNVIVHSGDMLNTSTQVDGFNEASVEGKSESNDVEVADNEIRRKVGRPKGSKGGGPKKFTAIPGDEEVAVVVKIPKILKESINNKAKESNKTFKEMVCKALIGCYMMEEKNPSNITEAITKLTDNPKSFIDFPAELQTDVTMQTAFVLSKEAMGDILSVCPNHLIESVSKEQWLEALKFNCNVIKKVPVKYRKAALKELAAFLK